MKKALLLLMLLPFVATSQTTLLRWRGQSGLAATSYDTHVTGSELSGAGINLSNDTYNGFLTSGWPAGSSINTGKYLQVSVAPTSGYQLTLSNLNFQHGLGYNNNDSNGPQKVTIKYSFNADFSNPVTILDGGAVTSTAVDQSVSFNNVVVATGKTLYVRIYGYNRGNTGWDGGVYRFPHVNTNNISAPQYGEGPAITGTVSLAPGVMANNDTATAVSGQPKSINVVSNDAAQGTTFNSVQIVSQPSNGTVTIQSIQSIVYTSTAGFTGNTSFQYKLVGANGSTSTATVNVTVVPMVVPVASNDNATTTKNTAKVVSVLSNDTPGSGAITAVAVTSAPSHGAAVVNANKTITYTPAANFAGTDSFTYTITDEYNNTAVATVNMTVTFPAIAGALNGTYIIGAATQYDYPQFTTITAAVNYLNANGVSGPVTFLFNDLLYNNATGESFPVTINPFSGSSAANTVTFKPNVAKNVVIEANNVDGSTGIPAVFKINGADNIVIDGSNANIATKNLTLFNKDYIDYIARTIVWIASNGNNPATNVTVKNTNLKMKVKNGTWQYCAGVYSGNNGVGENNTLTVAEATAVNDNIKIINNDFMNVKQGVYINGGAQQTTNVVVSQNDLGSEDNTETIIQPACFYNVNGFEYSENHVYNLYRDTPAGNLTSAGIFVTGASKNGYIVKNNMRDLKKTMTDEYTFAGITLASTVNNSNIIVANNFISNVSGNGNADASLNGHGINVALGGGYKIYHNTVVLKTNQANNGYSSALFINSGINNINVRNNIFVNLQTAGTRRTAIMVRDNNNGNSSIFSALDYNNYFSLDKIGYISNIGTSINWPEDPDYLATLAQWKTVTGKDAHSISVNPNFVGAANLHLSTNNTALDNAGIAIADVTKDIDGQLRNTQTPDMGADEFGASEMPAAGTNAGIYCASSTTWNGNFWSNGEPTAEKDAIFTGNYTQYGGTFTACSMFVQGTAAVLFRNESNAVITHNVNVAATASVTFESSSNLLQIENTQNVGNVTIKRNGSKLKRLDYTIWSSPVTGSQTLLQFSPLTLANRFYIFNTQQFVYESIASSATTTFSTARGYLIRMPDHIEGNQNTAYTNGGYRFSFEGVFQGTPNNGTIYYPLEFYPNNPAINMVGNPYPSPISISAFIDENIDNIEGTIWVWRKTNNPDETSYCTITKFGYIANNALGGGGNNGSDGNDLIGNPFAVDPSGILNTGQGFFVQAKNNQELVFTNSMRKGIHTNKFFRTNATADSGAQGTGVQGSRIWLNAANADATSSTQMMVGYTPLASLGYDNGIDGRSFSAGALSLYTLAGEEKLVIQGRPDFETSDVVNVGFSTQAGGNYTIAIDHVDGVFEGNQNIFIKDNITGTLHNLKAGSYTFTTEAGTFENRFELHYMDGTELGVAPQVKADDVVVYQNNRQIKIQSPEEIKSVTVYDITGKVIYQNNKVNATEFASATLTASQQVVIVQAELVNNQVVIKKILVN